MSHNPQNILRDLTRNPLHVGLVVACCLLSVAIIAVLVARESVRPAAKKKVHPLDKPPAKVVVTPEFRPVPHPSSFPKELALIAERSKLKDWGAIGEPVKVRVAIYLASLLHPKDSPYAHQERSFFYFNALTAYSDKPEFRELDLPTVCVANDHHFADYLASKAEAPAK